MSVGAATGASCLQPAAKVSASASAKAAAAPEFRVKEWIFIGSSSILLAVRRAGLVNCMGAYASIETLN
jgi:hypothetical protein